jgi:Na+-transporting methylmalonyl-CoA/oxaloacetate decarboxylase gamma subunit
MSCCNHNPGTIQNKPSVMFDNAIRVGVIIFLVVVIYHIIIMTTLKQKPVPEVDSNVHAACIELVEKANKSQGEVLTKLWIAVAHEEARTGIRIFAKPNIPDDLLGKLIYEHEVMDLLLKMQKEKNKPTGQPTGNPSGNSIGKIGTFEVELIGGSLLEDSSEVTIIEN